ncbi:hypothetical protein DE146DRAFT_240689 [Phaeosphaeria sp. MPI-PUGE-AT-0046c]|nr:hypothetical protein DE146DRAFT_240689 [Phaeosphaeria sp. MPI-PUGE-AT-0046c]
MQPDDPKAVLYLLLVACHVGKVIGVTLPEVSHQTSTQPDDHTCHPNYNPPRARLKAQYIPNNMGIFEGAQLFDHFFPANAPKYHRLLATHCQAEHAVYTTEPVSWKTCRPVLNCILDHTSEMDKAQLGVTSLILGLTPTILSWLGSGLFEMSLLSSQRPVLGLLLSLGAPVFSPSNLFPQWRPSDILDARPTAYKIPALVRRHAALVALAQYLLALAAIVNLTHVGYLLSYMAITLSGGCKNRFFVTLWTYVAVVVHICGWFAFHTRGVWVRGSGKGPLKSSLSNTMRHLAMVEMVPCISRSRHVLRWRPETPMGLFLVNLTTILALGHVVWGTAILGSQTLIEQVDAVMLIGRIVASTVVCKAILMFELAGMREVTALEEESVVVGSTSLDSTGNRPEASITFTSGAKRTTM